VTVYVITDYAGNVHGVTSSTPVVNPHHFRYEAFELDACHRCGAGVALDCTCDDNQFGGLVSPT
jgi:hypothetical protein